MKVKANANWGNLIDGEFNVPRHIGEVWETTKERGHYLLSKGVVDLVPTDEEMEQFAEQIVNQEVEIAKPKKRGRPKKS